MNKTIFSLVTKPITQNIAIIRISGDDAFYITNKIIDSKLEKKSIQLKNIKFNNKFIDQAMILKFNNPNSFTGENVIELHLHGSLLIVNEVITALIKFGATQALPGEFSERAMLNGKIDLVQAESINTLIFARSQIEKDKSLDDLQGKKKEVIWNIEKEILEIKTHLETNIDYPEYLDIKQLSEKDIIPRIEELIKKTNIIIDNSNKIKPAIKGYDIAIIGKPNVGKSSLLNYLVNKDKSIVSDEEGTTRDLIEERITFKGIDFNLIDTAGIRDAKNNIEKIGIEKAKKRLNNVQLIIDMYDGSTKNTSDDKKILELAKEAKNHISVINKTDMKNLSEIKGIHISVKDKRVKPLIDEIEKIVDNILADINIENYEYFINERQVTLIDKINATLLKIKYELSNQIPLDIIFIYIEEIENYLSDISGSVLENKELRNIFDNFCLGK